MISLKESVKNHRQEEKSVPEKVSEILGKIRQRGDEALQEFNALFDSCYRTSCLVSQEEISNAYKKIRQPILEDLRFASRQITEFAKKQKEMLNDLEVEVLPGVFLGHRAIPIESCAAYVPGGRYPLPSSALMSIIPAKVAGVNRVVACSPPEKGQQLINPATLVAMSMAGADEVYCMGGAQAIGAFAYGTETIKPVDVIVGPGNQYVTEAKRQVSGEVGIDFLAGPSEVVVIADHSADPFIIATDLLAQSEHDPQARGILLCTDEGVGRATLVEIEKLLIKLPTAPVAREAWVNNGEVVIVNNIDEAVHYANELAPEHLEVHVENASKIKPLLKNYGSLFLGKEAAEVFGDYVAGTNHILPTMRTSRYTGGVWVGTFIKVVTYQRLTRQGVQQLAPVASRLAKLEGLYAHKLAADVRLDLYTTS